MIALCIFALAAGHPIWVAAWADAPDSAGGPASAEQTFREIVKPTVGSRGVVRLHFSNFFGDRPIRIGAVHMGLQTSGAGVKGDAVVTFDGVGTVTIPPGGFATSDKMPFAFAYGSTLAITEYVAGSWDKLTKHNQAGSNVTSYATDRDSGNRTTDAAGTSFTQTTFETYLVDRVEVYGDYKGTVAAFGSSTTDGVRSGRDKHDSYPEQLAAALHAAGRDDVAIANAGISGNQLMKDGAGQAGLDRFSRDVASLPGVTAVIDYLGANDLRNSCITAESLIAGKQKLISQAHTAGLKIYLATIAASTFCRSQSPSGFGSRFPQGSGQEAQRFLLNSWLHSTQKQRPDADAILDFDTALADAANKSYMLQQYDSGDDIHPNPEGYRAMVKAIPLSLF